MDNRLEKAFKEKADCLVCGQSNEKVLGLRGNREYTGADAKAEPHLFTNVVECRNCGFIYTNPQIKGVDFLENEHYDNPDKIHIVVEMYAHRINLIKTFKAQGSLLDVGAGTGEFVLAAAQSGFDAIGIEPSPRSSEFAEKHYKVKVLNGLLEESAELKGRKFDVITLHHVFEHVEKPHELLETLKEFLSDDGIVYLEVPNTQSTTVKLIDAYFRLSGKKWSSRLSPLHPPFHKFGYNPKALNYILKEHGYKVIKIETFSGLSREMGGSGQPDGLLHVARNNVIKVVDALGSRDMLAFVFKK